MKWFSEPADKEQIKEQLYIKRREEYKKIWHEGIGKEIGLSFESAEENDKKFKKALIDAEDKTGFISFIKLLQLLIPELTPAQIHLLLLFKELKVK